ncbi:Lsr2 family protein [Brachybacterium paraconglomeratum]|uniref:histone-like nucleoid-structuring protein Lsr2 n=1 Tax=Brachybacterium paraconglomeratum TaxID=173362 RepID=UPI0031E65C8E
MTAKTIYLSDLSGEPDAVRATFGYAGEWHEVDLSPEELEALAMGLEPYIKAGRRLGRTLDDGKKRVVPETTVDEREAIRAWARENGHSLAERGRIPKRILAAYGRAHGVNTSPTI